MTLPLHERLEACPLTTITSSTQDTIRLSHHPDESDDEPGFLVIEIEDCDDHDTASTWLTVEGAIGLAHTLLVWAHTTEKMRSWRIYMDSLAKDPSPCPKDRTSNP